MSHVSLGKYRDALRTFEALQKAANTLVPMSVASDRPGYFRTVSEKNAWNEKEWLDKGFYTAAEGEIGIDILFAAASRKFGDYEKHIEEREIEGVKFKVLDIDGMLMSKETDRAEDLPDRKRLLRLKAGVLA